MTRTGYNPNPQPYGRTTWDRAEMQREGQVEKDSYSNASHLLHKLISYSAEIGLGEEDIHAIDSLTSTGE
jgi:hypothetical protein